MRILQINNDFANPLYALMLRALDRAGVESRVAVFTYPGAKTIPPAENVTVFPILRRLDRFFYFYKRRKCARALEAAEELHGYELCYAQFLFTGGGVALWLKKKYGIPYVAALSSTDTAWFFARIPHLRPFGLQIVREAARIVAFSPTYAAQLLRYIPAPERAAVESKLAIIPLGIDPAWLAHPRTHTRAAGEKTVRLICTGVLERRKNGLVTARACALLRERGYDAHCTFVGRIRHAGYAKAVRAQPDVTYLPPMQKEGLAALYETQDILVLPSITETFGLVYAEAMSQGLPVVYTRGEGFDGQFAEGQAGYAVDCHDPADVADAVERILADYDAMSARCARLAQKFDWTRIAAEYAALYAAVGENGEGEGERT